MERFSGFLCGYRSEHAGLIFIFASSTIEARYESRLEVKNIEAQSGPLSPEARRVQYAMGWLFVYT